jgi:5-methyltetrahydropteroyltriglutamate--homocysteine methyltransferase
VRATAKLITSSTGADCGFASFSTSCEVHPSVVWTKLAALGEGARLATKELF